MGDEPKEPADDKQGQGQVVPWVQTIAIIAVAVLAGFNLTQPDADVPMIVYAVLAAIAIGVDPSSLWQIFKGK